MQYIEHAPTGDLVVVLDADETARWRDSDDGFLDFYPLICWERALRIQVGLGRHPAKDAKLTIRFADGSLACTVEPNDDCDLEIL